jgi:hypothetical protein
MRYIWSPVSQRPDRDQVAGIYSASSNCESRKTLPGKGHLSFSRKTSQIQTCDAFCWEAHLDKRTELCSAWEPELARHSFISPQLFIIPALLSLLQHFDFHVLKLFSPSSCFGFRKLY